MGEKREVLQDKSLNTPSPAPVIAVLDDEACIRIALERLLRSAGYRVKSYADAAQFLVCVAKECPDVLVSDLRMPEIDGFEVMDALKEVGIHLPVIILTAEHSPLAQDRAKAAGALAYLTKPVNDGDLFAALSRALASSKMPSDH